MVVPPAAVLAAAVVTAEIQGTANAAAADVRIKDVHYSSFSQHFPMRSVDDELRQQCMEFDSGYKAMFEEHGSCVPYDPYVGRKCARLCESVYSDLSIAVTGNQMVRHAAGEFMVTILVGAQQCKVKSV